MDMKPRMSTIMPVTLPLVKEKKNLGSLPIWTSCLQVVVGRQIHTNQKLSMVKLYARGSSDDKRPTMACYYGLKIIKDLGLPVSKRVRFVVGTDEESGWGDMDYYFKHIGLPRARFWLLTRCGIPNHPMGKKETSLSTFILEMTTQELPIFIALQVAFVKTWYQSRRLQSFFWTTSRSCWPLRCLCQGTPAQA